MSIGIVANPMSGRDIRRLVAKASVFPTAEKANMIERILAAAAEVGVKEVLLSTDVGGVSSAVLRSLTARRTSQRALPWPDVEFVELPAHSQTAADSIATVHEMVRRGVRVIICLGGDGTARVVAGACGETPMLPLSTGTNNAFPQLREATVAGLAAGLLATGAVDADDGTRRAGMLVVTAHTPSGPRTENALVDVAVSRARDVGARALWHPEQLTELYVTFAEPDGIGLSSIPGQLAPSPRHEPDGVALQLAPPADAPIVVRAPIAPGLVAPVGVRSCRVLRVGESVEITTPTGVIAVDGEREVSFVAGAGPPVVTLTADGPRVVDITAVLTRSAAEGLLRRP